MLTLHINGNDHSLEVDPDTPLLWVLRDHLGLTGTKFGCGMGLCGACTVHIDGQPVRTCTLPVSALGARAVTTIEGLGEHPLKAAWIAEQVPQCGYCQAGQLMQAAGLLADNPRPTDTEIGAAMTNLCRCGTYDRIRRAIHRAAAQLPESPPESPPSDGTEAATTGEAQP